jgi:hypothetical protein
MALDNTLEALSFGLATDADVLSFCEHIVHLEGVSCLKFLFKGIELRQTTLWSDTRTLEVTLHGLRSVLFGTLAVTKLNGFIAVPLEGTYLRHDARTNFQYCAWEILPSGTVDAGHAYFFPYESGHGD